MVGMARGACVTEAGTRVGGSLYAMAGYASSSLSARAKRHGKLCCYRSMNSSYHTLVMEEYVDIDIDIDIDIENMCCTQKNASKQKMRT